MWGQTSQLVTIDPLKPSDSGNYTCTVSRATVSMSAYVIIFVVGKFPDYTFKCTCIDCVDELGFVFIDRVK